MCTPHSLPTGSYQLTNNASLSCSVVVGVGQIGTPICQALLREKLARLTVVSRECNSENEATLKDLESKGAALAYCGMPPKSKQVLGSNLFFCRFLRQRRQALPNFSRCRYRAHFNARQCGHHPKYHAAFPCGGCCRQGQALCAVRIRRQHVLGGEGTRTFCNLYTFFVSFFTDCEGRCHHLRRQEGVLNRRHGERAQLDHALYWRYRTPNFATQNLNTSIRLHALPRAELQDVHTSSPSVSLTPELQSFPSEILSAPTFFRAAPLLKRPSPHAGTPSSRPLATSPEPTRRTTLTTSARCLFPHPQ
jgi:hypothetical protein